MVWFGVSSMQHYLGKLARSASKNLAYIKPEEWGLATRSVWMSDIHVGIDECVIGYTLLVARPWRRRSRLVAKEAVGGRR